MRRFIRISTVAIGIICTLVLGAGTVLSNALPSKFSVSKTGREGLSVYGVTLNSYRSNGAGSKTGGKLMLGNIVPIKDVQINIKENENESVDLS